LRNKDIIFEDRGLKKLKEESGHMQKWDYLYIFRSRSWKQTIVGNYQGATDWVNEIYTLGEKKTNPYKDLPNALIKLGEEGWELVAVTPRSSHLGEHTAGFTSEELWVFKRPKE
jgi:hypothetical protein